MCVNFSNSKRITFELDIPFFLKELHFLEFSMITKIDSYFIFTYLSFYLELKKLGNLMKKTETSNIYEIQVFFIKNLFTKEMFHKLRSSFSLLHTDLH